MSSVLLVDFGSTYTKVLGVDLDNEEILGSACARTTVETDVTIGLNLALMELQEHIGRPVKFEGRFGCSSAAGGLKMVAIGIVPSLTVAAAKMGALGAGARVEEVFAWEMKEEDIKVLETIDPDIILFTGGTDGGNTKIVRHNAELLGRSQVLTPLVVACNIEVRDEVTDILKRSGRDVRVADNIMPELGQVNVEPVREVIRGVFMDRIVQAKGLCKAESLLDGIFMPTPDAVLKAATLLANGTKKVKGFGNLMIVDVGGATTDVYSVARGEPRSPGIIMKGLTPPYSYRSVEGDLGVRRSARALSCVIGKELISQVSGLNESDVERSIEEISFYPERLPHTKEDFDFDFALGYLAVKEAVKRHSGRYEIKYTFDGPLNIQYGKDLTEIPLLIGTGGILTYHPRRRDMLLGGIGYKEGSLSLIPSAPRLLFDKKYILACMGLLSNERPEVSLRILKRFLTD